MSSREEKDIGSEAAEKVGISRDVAIQNAESVISDATKNSSTPYTPQQEPKDSK